MTTMKQLCLSLLLVFIVTACFVLPGEAVTEEEITDYLLNDYNPNSSEVIGDLPLVGSIFGGQVIHGIIEKPGGNIDLAVFTDSNVYITKLESGEPDNPTLRVTATEATVDKIMGSSDPASEALNALKNKEITYEGIGIKNTIVIGGSKLGLFFAKLFGIV